MHIIGLILLIVHKVQLYSSKFDVRTISLTYSTLYLNDVYFNNLKFFELLANSSVNVTSDSKIASDDLTITLNSSDLYYDDSVDISSSSVSLIAINSRFQNDFDFDNIRVLDLSFSTFESASSIHIIVGYFSCFHCQLLGNSSLLTETYSEINSGNFSSSLVVTQSADTNTLIGQVQLANSIDFFSYVILDDVSVSEFQSSIGSIICHSDVLMRNVVAISSIPFVFHNALILSDATVFLDPLFVLLDFQTLKGVGTIDTNILNFGRINPSSTLTFNDNLTLSFSSIVTLQISNDSSSTQLIVGSTAYLDGILEIEFDTKSDSTRYNYTLIESDQINGRFRSIINPCASLITTFYSKSSLIVSVNDFVVDLQQGSYVSPTGVDDPCCGTFDSPCASFRGVLERMGRKGTVYFHSGHYLFNQGFGKLIDVDWEVIGLVDVIIDGSDETILDIIYSSLTFHNLIIYGKNVVFEVSDSSIIFDFVSVLSVSNDTMFLIENSSLTTTNCLFDIDSFRLFECIESLLFINNSSFSGSLSDSLISLSSSSMIFDNTLFNDLNVNNLVVSSSSSIKLNHLSITEVTANTVFQLHQSIILMNNLIVFSIFSKDFCL
ncbi:hypothetical protein GEMRC1_008228 [Eukaryota sp. GEM-RC1]